MTRQRVTDWLAGRRTPTLEQGLAILGTSFLTSLRALSELPCGGSTAKRKVVSNFIGHPIRKKAADLEAAGNRSFGHVPDRVAL